MEYGFHKKVSRLIRISFSFLGIRESYRMDRSSLVLQIFHLSPFRHMGAFQFLVPLLFVDQSYVTNFVQEVMRENTYNFWIKHFAALCSGFTFLVLQNLVVVWTVKGPSPWSWSENVDDAEQSHLLTHSGHVKQEEHNVVLSGHWDFGVVCYNTM